MIMIQIKIKSTHTQERKLDIIIDLIWSGNRNQIKFDFIGHGDGGGMVGWLVLCRNHSLWSHWLSDSIWHALIKRHLTVVRWDMVVLSHNLLLSIMMKMQMKSSFHCLFSFLISQSYRLWECEIEPWQLGRENWTQAHNSWFVRLFFFPYQTGQSIFGDFTDRHTWDLRSLEFWGIFLTSEYVEFGGIDRLAIARETEGLLLLRMITCIHLHTHEEERHMHFSYYFWVFI